MKLEITFSDGGKYVEKFVDKESVESLMEHIQLNGFKQAWGNVDNCWINLTCVRAVRIVED